MDLIAVIIIGVIVAATGAIIQNQKVQMKLQKLQKHKLQRQ